MENFIFNAGYQIFAIIVPFITAPYISRILGPDGVGEYGYSYSIVSYFILLATLGTATYGNKVIGYYQDNPKEYSIRFWNIFCFRMITAGVSLVGYLLYALFVTENKVVALLQSLYIVGVACDVTWFLQGMEQFKKIAIRNFVFKLLSIVMIFVCVKDKGDVWGYVLCLSGFTLAGNISILPYMKRYLVKIKISQIRPYENINEILRLFLPTVAAQIHAVLNMSMIGWLSNVFENGYYEQAEKISKMGLMLITTLGTVLIPRVSQSVSKSNYDEVKKYINRAIDFIWALGIPMTMGLICIAEELVPIFYGNGYEKVEELLKIMSLLFVPMGFSNVMSRVFFIPTNRTLAYNKMLIFGVFINILLNIALIPFLHSVGSCIATVCGEVGIFIIQIFYIARFGCWDKKKVTVNLFKYLWSGAIMIFAVKATLYITNNEIINLILSVIAGICAYTLSLYYLRIPLMRELFHIKRDVAHGKDGHASI